MKRKYPISYYIIAITVAFFLLQQLSKMLFGYDFPLLYGAKINEFILKGEIWRLVTPLLLHGSILHIAFNMYALYTVGPGLERRYGPISFITLYLIGGLWGNTASFLFSANPSLGASTAIFGLIAAQGVYIYKNRFLLGQAAQPLLVNVIVVIVINLLFGLSTSGIDNWGHLGGLLGGLFYAWFAGPTYGIDSTITFGNVVIAHPKNPRMIGLGAALTALLLVLAKILMA
ncbi:rhomboid family intramembrane serine protease [Pelolinea submarina]|uniref:Membrane associated rhomboid family serine protease n=1 Tax=Pelolinea submarina TaxID=913107 RepID=A0A347ZVX8_9CHLR|nr:rhomboid family intramembrane serine protease [Pelolinea submarina]REG07156.1 membrane associated rhomboid family serine protease [Pelolinea submarina]BBB49459.1 rhomboid protease GluP [Pelolinea submarina]